MAGFRVDPGGRGKAVRAAEELELVRDKSLRDFKEGCPPGRVGARADHPLPDLEVSRIGFKQMTGEAEDLLSRPEGGEVDRLSPLHGDPGAGARAPKGIDGGVHRLHPERFVGDVHRLGGDLCENGFAPLPKIDHPGRYLKLPPRGEVHAGLGGRVRIPGPVETARHADSLETIVSAPAGSAHAPAAGRVRLFKGLDQAHALVEALVPRCSHTRTQAVDAAKFDGVDPETFGESVHLLLPGEVDLGAIGAAHLPAVGVVRVNAKNVHLRVRHRVGAQRVVGGPFEGGRIVPAAAA